MKPWFLYWCVLIVLSMSSCYKRHYPALATIYLSQEFKDYAVFQPGSYWIYQDSANASSTDSIILTTHTDLFQPQENLIPPFEYFNDLLWSSKDWYVPANGGCGLGPDSNSICYYSVDSANIGYSNEYTFFTGTKPGSKIEPDDILYYSQFLDSMSINGIQYKNVKVFKVDLSSVASLSLLNKAKVYEIYWAKNVGVIKSKTSTGRVWMLKRYSVKQ
jgi:hypothetical protein